MRNPIIEYARYIFAFLVVCIHVHLAHGGTLLFPFARCAVPFFYLVTGYFIGKSNAINNNLSQTLEKNIKKWILLYLTYTAILILIGSAIDLISGYTKIWKWDDTIAFLATGNCLFLEEHMCNNKIYGTSTLWFIYGGFWALILFKLIRKYLFSPYVLITIISLQLSTAIIRYLNPLSAQYTPLVYLSIPFLYYGILLGHHYKNVIHIGQKQNQLYLLYSICFISFIIGIIELKWKGIIFSTIPFSLTLFILILLTSEKYKDKIKFVPPHSHTLDVYIWHRLVYYLLVCLGVKFYGYDAIIVFIITLILSICIRNIRKTINLNN